MAARTAVVAGTATAVSGAVAGHQADKRQQAAQSDAYEQQQMAAQAAPAAPAAPAQDELTAKLEQLASLHAQGILSDEEFASAKAKALGL
jgi:membrane protease subunit (stomatin/prohibitin family)